jgi:hypothetical protein
MDTRFIATNLVAGSPRTIYEEVYCQRAQAENLINLFKTAADRTSRQTSSANRLPLFLCAGAYWLMWHQVARACHRRDCWLAMPESMRRVRGTSASHGSGKARSARFSRSRR